MSSQTWNSVPGTKLCGTKLFCPIWRGQNFFAQWCPGQKKCLSRQLLGAHSSGTMTVLADTLGFFSIERDWPSRLVLHVICERIIWAVLISQKEEMRTGTKSSGVVLHNMIERIYFYFIIFSQKRNRKQETHGRRGSSWCFPQSFLVNIPSRSDLTVSPGTPFHNYLLTWN